MDNKKSVVLLSVLLVFLTVAAFYPSAQNVNPVIGLVIAEQKIVNLARNDKLEINLANEKYFLTVSAISWGRDSANFILTSDINSAASYFQQYFRLDFDRVRTTMYNNPEIIYTQPQRSKILNIGKDKKLYIELVSIENRRVNLIVKWV
jgi:hypothetical protein